MMYRDERETLRDEVMQLRRELERAKTDQERLAQLERMLEMANRELASLRGTMGGTPARRTAPNTTVLAVVAAVFFAALGAGFLVTVRRSTSAPEPPRGPIATTPTTEPVAPTPTPLPPEPAITATPTPIPKPAKSVRTTWHATVTKVQGMTIAPGTACTLEATVSNDASGMGADDLLVTCGGKKLYDSHDELEGMSSDSSDAKQYAGEKSGTWTYALVYSDVGARGPSRNQVAIDSTKQIGKVWSDNLPDFRVDFSIKTKSDPVGVAIADQ